MRCATVGTSERTTSFAYLNALNTSSAMFTYEDSVLSAADEDGNLTHNDATRLLTDHGFTMEDVYADNNGVSWVALDARNAEALLAWLGY